ncbi:aminotransferase class V-fold PLP-dependent enzyme [Rapidithrix thailandica]|uniref:Aminotransferase class V-fold PLP-dependent enzyme n=1 Tax=Rapidithrix thailandica TaxID=413964 RepID=A0AAW9RYX3_9BACT
MEKQLQEEAQSKVLEEYFQAFAKKIIGQTQVFQSPYGEQAILYADWTASGRLYRPIEEALIETFGPFVGNTHTETSVTGTSMTVAYHEAKEIIKKHVNASDQDVLIAFGSGMTGVINKFQRMLGLKVPEQFKQKIEFPEEDKPVVFLTHMEHHSNHTSWLETIADVELINPTEEGLVDLGHLETLLKKYAHRKQKIAAVTACSNVTGVTTPYHQIAKITHQHGGLCFVDFACSAPYVAIDMHPSDPQEKLDAILFSPHKFLGGPGTPGILIFDSALYQSNVPDHPGGGTVMWTNPWKKHRYIDNIEVREDGGTPAFLQTIKTALCVKLKEEMGIDKMLEREKTMLKKVFKVLKPLPNLHILAGDLEERLGVISFYIDDLHYNLAVKLLNDRYGIQVRGGCSCAGTYGHYLLHVSKQYSDTITCAIDKGNLSTKPGWVRMSIHPTMSDKDLSYILDAIKNLSEHFGDWAKEYEYDPNTNEFTHRSMLKHQHDDIKAWFQRAL